MSNFEFNFGNENVLSEQIIQQVLQLREQLRHHNHLYYVLDNPQISDAQYDILFRQ